MYIESYWGSYVGGTDDSLTLLSLLEDFEKDEIEGSVRFLHGQALRRSKSGSPRFA